VVFFSGLRYATINIAALTKMTWQIMHIDNGENFGGDGRQKPQE
jgi:hypothetical protein